jgi:hypothetical protein
MRLGTITYHPATTKIITHGKWLWPEYFCVLFNLTFGINKLEKMQASGFSGLRIFCDHREYLAGIRLKAPEAGLNVQRVEIDADRALSLWCEQSLF